MRGALSRAERIRQEADRRCVDHLLHLTWSGNLPGIVRDGLLSRDALQNLYGTDASAPDTTVHVIGDRLDGNSDATSVAVSRLPSYILDFKASGVVERDPAKEGLVILLLDRSILWTHSCRFYDQNASKTWMKGQTERGRLTWAEDFIEMFADFAVGNGRSYRTVQGRQICEPTMDGAEVQFTGRIAPEFIKGAWVGNPGLIDAVQAHLASLSLRFGSVRSGDLRGRCPFINALMVAREDLAEGRHFYDEMGGEDFDGMGRYVCKGLTIRSDGDWDVTD